MFRMKILLIVLGGFATYWGATESWLALHCSQKPQTIRCIDLINNGHGDNAHVVLADFIACTNYFVYEAASNRPGYSGPYQEVYLPCLELDGPWHQQCLAAVEKHGDDAELPAPKDIRLILKLTDVKNDDRLCYQVDQDTLQGLIVNSVEGLDSEERKLLRQGYPNINLSKCLILQVGRKPRSLAVPVLALLGGVAMVVTGGVWLLKRNRPKVAIRSRTASPYAPPRDASPYAPSQDAAPADAQQQPGRTSWPADNTRDQ